MHTALIVYGFGERKTPRPFITACDKFVYFDVLTRSGEPKAVEAGAKVATTPTKVPLATPAELLREVGDDGMREAAYLGW